jgi:hypothetical protein
MMSRIPILLDEETAAGLVALAKQQYRDPRAQAALIIRQELERLGLLPVHEAANTVSLAARRVEPNSDNTADGDHAA